MDLLNNTIGVAATKAAATNKIYIVYKSGKGYEYIDKGFRKGVYEAIVIPRKNNITVKDADGKTIKTISTVVEKAKDEPNPKSKKDTSKSKDVEKSSTD